MTTTDQAPEPRPLTDLIGLAPDLTGGLDVDEYLARQNCDHGPKLDELTAEVAKLRRELAATTEGERRWEYGYYDADDDQTYAYDRTPAIITPKMLRRPVVPVGPWEPAPAVAQADGGEQAGQEGGR